MVAFTTKSTVVMRSSCDGRCAHSAIDSLSPAMRKECVSSAQDVRASELAPRQRASGNEIRRRIVMASTRVRVAPVEGADKLFTPEFNAYLLVLHDRLGSRVHDLIAK